MTNTAKPNITYFDLDAVVQDQVIVKLKGVEYPLEPVSVENFVSNTRLIAELGDIGDDMDKQFDLTVKLAMQAFPTMPESIFKGMSMLQMNKLVELAHSMNGQKEAEDKVAAEKAKLVSENPPVEQVAA